MRHCFSCDGSGRKPDLTEICEVCGGKGYWTEADIRAYHAKYPVVCARSCGPVHIEVPAGVEKWERERILSSLILAMLDAKIERWRSGADGVSACADFHVLRVLQDVRGAIESLSRDFINE